MLKLIVPMAYYRVSLSDLSEDLQSSAYDWAIGQDAWLPDGDGDVMLYGIPKLIETYEWADELWNKIPLLKQNEIMRNERGLSLYISQ